MAADSWRAEQTSLMAFDLNSMTSLLSISSVNLTLNEMDWDQNLVSLDECVGQRSEAENGPEVKMEFIRSFISYLMGGSRVQARFFVHI